MDLVEVEREIEGFYRWFSANAPGVRVREVGRLAQLWREFDSRVDSEGSDTQATGPDAF